MLFEFVLCRRVRGKTIESCCSMVNVTVIDGIVDQHVGKQTWLLGYICIYIYIDINDK